MKDLIKKLVFNRKSLAVIGVTLIVIIVAFIIFENLSISYARHWDISYGYYAILITFILFIIGCILNAPIIAQNFKSFLPSGKSICAFVCVALVFSVFIFGNISNTHRVLSDETSWESMGLQMFFEHSGGICNEGFWTDNTLNCKTEVNNFKGKALGFVYSLVFNFMEPTRDTALLVNYPFYLFSLLFFFFALSKWFKNEWAALAATAFLGGMPIYLLQARSASTEVLYIFLLTLLMAWYAFIPANKVNWKQFFITVPLLGLFAQTRQETVFAFVPFALYYYKYFFARVHRLPLFVASAIALSWPSINTMAAYRGYDFQGGEHAAHSLENFWFNLKTNINIMLNLESDNAFGGIMQNPFYTSFTIITLIATTWLLFRLIYSRKYIYGAILGITFCFQIFVILLNVSGTFTIDINQRYVLVALPLFALIMSLGLFDLLEFFTKIKRDVAGKIICSLAIMLSVGLMLYHAESFRHNMLYYKNMLLNEEDYLNTALKSFPKNSIYIYARPWQMLASKHSSFSERTFMGLDTETFAKWQKLSNNNIYIVRGQDGYGELNRKSRVVGFKTTSQIDEIINNYKVDRVLLEPKLFGYPLTIYKIIAKKGVSAYSQNFFVNDMENNSIEISKRFPEAITCSYSLNGELQEDLVITHSLDTLQLDSSKILDGMNSVLFECIMPDSDTLKIAKDFFVESQNVLLLSNLKMESFTQEWGAPQINATVDHNKITLDKRVYRYGIGSHANSKLRYLLPNSYKTFYATIGLDDESACGDGAYFTVVGDGRELYKSEQMYSTQKKQISVNVSKISNLELNIHSGNNINCDHGNWANAWLRK